MYNHIKSSFEEGAAGIDVACNHCGKSNFVSTYAMAATVVCRHCGKGLKLSKQSKEYLCAMIALANNQG